MEKHNHPKIRLLSPKGEEGSLALEHILFIGAIVALSAGLFIFYDRLSDYFESVDLSNLPTTVSTPDDGASN